MSGASALELLIVTPVLMLIALGLVQTAVLYRAHSILSYATLEAARVGTTQNAQSEPMMSALLLRLIPLAPIQSSFRITAGTMLPDAQQMAQLRSRTRLERLSPDAHTFDDWGTVVGESGPEIPNSHLRYRSSPDVSGSVSGLNLAEANLLRIRTLHAFEMRVPFIGSMIAAVLLRLNPAQAQYYRLGQLPLTGSATLRMQSNAFRQWDASAAEFAPNLAQLSESGGENTELCEFHEPGPGAVSAGLAWITDSVSTVDGCGTALVSINDLYALLSVNSEHGSVACSSSNTLAGSD